MYDTIIVAYLMQTCNSGIIMVSITNQRASSFERSSLN